MANKTILLEKAFKVRDRTKTESPPHEKMSELDPYCESCNSKKGLFKAYTDRKLYVSSVRYKSQYLFQVLYSVIACGLNCNSKRLYPENNLFHKAPCMCLHRDYYVWGELCLGEKADGILLQEPARKKVARAFKPASEPATSRPEDLMQTSFGGSTISGRKSIESEDQFIEKQSSEIDSAARGSATADNKNDEKTSNTEETENTPSPWLLPWCADDEGEVRPFERVVIPTGEDGSLPRSLLADQTVPGASSLASHLDEPFLAMCSIGEGSTANVFYAVDMLTIACAVKKYAIRAMKDSTNTPSNSSYYLTAASKCSIELKVAQAIYKNDTHMKFRSVKLNDIDCLVMPLCRPISTMDRQEIAASIAKQNKIKEAYKTFVDSGYEYGTGDIEWRHVAWHPILKDEYVLLDMGDLKRPTKRVDVNSIVDAFIETLMKRL